MNIKVLILSLLIASICSCNNNSVSNDSVKEINGELLVVDDLFLGAPSELILRDSILLVYDRFENYLLTQIDVKNDRYLGRLILEGRGPGEAIPPAKISFYDNNLNVFQFQTGALNIYDDKFNFQKQFFFEDHPANIKQMRNAFIGFGAFEQGRFHIYDMNGKCVGFAGDFPDESNNMDQLARFVLYQGHLASSKNGRYFAFGYAYSDNIEFYDMKDKEVELIRTYGEGSVKGRYAGRLELDDDCLMGYKWAYGGDKYCYMLYLGKTLAENNYNKYWADNIVVFDWKGHHVKTFKLDVPILSFCVDEKNQIIYGLTVSNDEFVIMRYKM